MSVLLWFVGGLLAAAVIVLSVRLLRLHRVLEQERQENRHLRELLFIGSRETESKLGHLRRLRHDLRRYLQTAEGPTLPQELSSALNQPISPPGNWTLSALVSLYQSQAQALGIEADLCLPVEPDLDELLPDFCLILSNLLENSLEALAREGGGWLRARCTSSGGGYISLVVANSSATHLRRINRRYLSSKRGIRFGTGLSTVQGIVRRRGGRAEFTADGQQFRASIFLPCSSPKDSPVCASSPRGDSPLK